MVVLGLLKTIIGIWYILKIKIFSLIELIFIRYLLRLVIVWYIFIGLSYFIQTWKFTSIKFPLIVFLVSKLRLGGTIFQKQGLVLFLQVRLQFFQIWIVFEIILIVLHVFLERDLLILNKILSIIDILLCIFMQLAQLSFRSWLSKVSHFKLIIILVLLFFLVFKRLTLSIPFNWFWFWSRFFWSYSEFHRLWLYRFFLIGENFLLITLRDSRLGFRLIGILE